ncbi:hypothetical protein FA95DRAFT_1683845 [Auriscalpium vulgare]|uniref:Uncharacterized protein n=1 Tax=Auriscalpium vulgare TaxID=40419 RepID=A0ACB8R832_9AGAM|nr:hypothetical protein FA95DRAFT_1683845 [Auriscalpium vulgare]
MASHDEVIASLRSATSGFDCIFSNDLVEAEKIFQTNEDSPFHLLGLGVCAFLQAALGMESGFMSEASRLLSLAETGAKKQLKHNKSLPAASRFPAATEWDLMYADAIILYGMTHALNESYRGYLQCLYALNNAHSRFTRLYKTVFPQGLDAYHTPSTSQVPSRKPSLLSTANGTSSSSASSLTTSPSTSKSHSFLGRLGSSLTGSRSVSGTSTPSLAVNTANDGPIEELIISGTAFGYGLFNLVLSLLPARAKSVVGFFGFNHDRKLALRALAVSATKSDIHSVFAGLALLTYHGDVLLVSGYQADERHILNQCKAIVDKLEARYPSGTLWILNRAKILRMSGDATGAIKVLQGGLSPDRPTVFLQADALLVFELAWLYLAQRRYKDAAEAFMRMTELNAWSHATYYYFAAGCHCALGSFVEAQRLFDAIPSLIDKRKIGNKDLPTEVFVKKKLAFFKAKQTRLTGSDKDYVKAISINPADEMSVFWNTYGRISKTTAEAYINDWLQTSPPVELRTPYSDTLTPPTYAQPPPALDTPDELALRALLLGIAHRAAGVHAVARAFLLDAHRRQPELQVSTWIGGIAQFELAVLELKDAARYEGESAQALGAEEREDGDADANVEGVLTEAARAHWAKALKDAGACLDTAGSLAGSEIDLSARLETRTQMLRDEIGLKKESLGL